jgi:PAS domain S-box-containing protein
MSAGRRRIAIVNDDPVQLGLLGGILEKHDFEVWANLSASAALDDMDPSRVPDLIITDLHMPGIDGWKFCRLLRSPDYAHLADVPILVMSATFSGAEVEALTRELGAEAFLPNPSPPDQLLRYVESLLAGEQPKSPPDILIVDDDARVLDVLSRFHTAHGWKVHQASTAAEARSVFAEKRPAVALLDYHLPDDADKTLLEEIRRPARSTVVIVMTGDTDPSLPVELLQQGADGYARKPFEPQYILDLVHAAQRERSLLRVEDILEARTQELRASEARYRILFASIPEGILIVGKDGVVLQSNPVMDEWLGATEQGLAGAHVEELVQDERRRGLRDDMARIWSAGSGDLSTAFARIDGSAKECEVTLRTFQFQDRHALLCVCRDVTERNRMEAERKSFESRMQHAQKLESLGVLAGGVAHDFNNLLVGILGNASLAAMDLSERGPAWESIKQIELAARRAADLTGQILTYTGKAVLSSEPVNLNQLVREMTQLMEPAISKKALLSFDMREEIPPVRCDPGQLRQVVMNLIMNASDALEGRRGSIRVRTGWVQAGAEELRRGYLGEGAAPGHYAFLEVEDSGAGMDQETQDRMFDPFFTTKVEGRGLGLAATLGIVRGHGGTIQVRSAPDEGTTFRVLLPAQDRAPDREPASREAPSSLAPGSGTVLVVDDEDAVRKLAVTALQRFGYRTLAASGGEEALQILDDPAKAPVDIVLLDLSMPGMDGAEVLEAIARRDRRVPVLFSSGYSEDAVAGQIHGRGVAGFIRKPYSPGELVDRVQRALASAASPEDAGQAATG